MVALDRAVCPSKCRAHARNACGGQCCLQAHRQRIPGAPFRCDVGAKCGGARVHQRGAPQRVAWQAEHPREHSIGSAPPCARWRLVLGGASLVAAWVNPSQSLTLVQLAAWRNSPWGYLHLSALTTAFAARTSGRGRTQPSLSRALAEERPLSLTPRGLRQRGGQGYYPGNNDLVKVAYDRVVPKRNEEMAADSMDALKQCQPPTTHSHC